MAKAFIIRPLEPTDSNAVSAFMLSQNPAYIRFFYALGFDEEAIRNTLTVSKSDIYSGVFWEGEIAGIFMVRGWDEGFDIPAFGVLIDEKYRGGSFMRLTLDIAKLICKLSGSQKLMAKIHPDNMGPRGARRLGLHQVGVEESTGNIVYHLEL